MLASQHDVAATGEHLAISQTFVDTEPAGDFCVSVDCTWKTTKLFIGCSSWKSTREKKHNKMCSADLFRRTELCWEVNITLGLAL